MTTLHQHLAPVPLLRRQSVVAAPVCSAASTSRNSRRAWWPRLHPCPSRVRMRIMARTMSSLPRLPIFEAIARHDPRSTSVIHSSSGRTFTYGELLRDVRAARERLYVATGKSDLDGERVAFLMENSYDYVVTLLAVLAAQAIAVPMSPAFPAAELQYVLNHSEALLLVSSSKFASKAQEVLAADDMSAGPRRPLRLELPKHYPDDSRGTAERVPLEESGPARAGLMLYTSGTTNKPKGVLIPQSALTAQAHSLIQAWEYAPADHLLHVLPLHHIHGTVNAVITPLFAGSSIEFMFPFNADAVWKRLAAPFLPSSHGDSSRSSDLASLSSTPSSASSSRTPLPKVTFFTVVPTVYSRLLVSHKQLSADTQQAAREAISPQNLRVNISGSAALPTPIKAAWQDLSNGNVLLERYGMTEVGMALSCGLNYADRVDASVGWPLPSVQARLCDVDTGEVIPPGQDVDAHGRPRSGEIQLRGPTIFAEYWRNPSATASEFVDAEDANHPQPDGSSSRWFKTGDIAYRRSVPRASSSLSSASSSSPSPSRQHWAQGPMFFIQGRLSADIIKTGGEKVSALEVERQLLSLPEVAEAAVVAVPSGNWGQKVAAVVVLTKNQHHQPQQPQRGTKSEPKIWTPLEMRRALKPSLASYKIPQIMKVVDHIPRNAMGKINKKQLVKDMFLDEHSGDES